LQFGNIGQHRWLRLLLVTAGVYLVLLPLWWQSLPALATVAAACADALYHFFNSRVSIVSDGSQINVFVTASEQSGFGGQVHSSGLRLSTITYGLPMLMALVVSTRADTIVAKLRALGLGVAVMLLLTVPAVMVWASVTNLQLKDRIAAATNGMSSDQSTSLYYVFHGYAFSQPVLAAGIWMALMMLGLFKQKPRERQAAASSATGRNDPCPCGSGRKFKRCCGKA
jgi:hypothetical protein